MISMPVQHSQAESTYSTNMHSSMTLLSQVGVVAYGPATCGSGPDFAVRVSYYAYFILDLVMQDTCVLDPSGLERQLLDVPRVRIPPPSKAPPSTPPTIVRPPPPQSPSPQPPPPTPLLLSPAQTSIATIQAEVFDTPDVVGEQTPTETPASILGPDATEIGATNEGTPTTPVTSWTTAANLPGAFSATPAPSEYISTPIPPNVPTATQTTPATTLGPTSFPQGTPDQIPSCLVTSTSCKDGQIIRRKPHSCDCVWPLEVSYQLIHRSTEWSSSWTRQLRDSLESALQIGDKSRLVVEKLVSSVAHSGESDSRIAVTFLVLPYPEISWSPSDVRVIRELLRSGSVLAAEGSNIQVIDLQVSSREPARWSTADGKFAAVVSCCVVGLALPAIVCCFILQQRRARTSALLIATEANGFDSNAPTCQNSPQAADTAVQAWYGNVAPWLCVPLRPFDLRTAFLKRIQGERQTEGSLEELKTDTPRTERIRSLCTVERNRDQPARLDSPRDGNDNVAMSMHPTSYQSSIPKLAPLRVEVPGNPSRTHGVVFPLDDSAYSPTRAGLHQVVHPTEVGPAHPLSPDLPC